MFTSVLRVRLHPRPAGYGVAPFGILALDSVYVWVLFSGALGTRKHGWDTLEEKHGGSVCESVGARASHKLLDV